MFDNDELQAMAEDRDNPAAAEEAVAAEAQAPDKAQEEAQEEAKEATTVNNG